MTRRAAREIAVQLCFGALFTDAEPANAVEDLFDPEYFSTLSAENEFFDQKPDEQQRAYILQLVSLVQEHREELDEAIRKYAKGWKLERISRIAATVLRCAMAEILYMDDIPSAVTINEAVELAKGYEEPETVAFINGILGSFVRGDSVE